jgi:hypothetical protein
MCFGTSTSAGAILIAVSFILTLNLKGETHMNLIFRIIAITTLALAASAVDAPNSDALLEQSASKCCADYCGTDKQCFYFCTHDPGGPCPR